MSSVAATPAAPATGALTKGHKKVIFASSLGTVFEWYDFYTVRIAGGDLHEEQIPPPPLRAVGPIFQRGQMQVR